MYNKISHVSFQDQSGGGYVPQGRLVEGPFRKLDSSKGEGTYMALQPWVMPQDYPGPISIPCNKAPKARQIAKLVQFLEFK